MDLALGGAGADRAPADQVRVELSERGVEELGTGRQSDRRDVGEQLPRETQPLVDVKRRVEVRIVDETLPPDRCARLLEVHAHDQQQSIGNRVRQWPEPLRVLDRSNRIVDRTRANDYGEARIVAIEDRFERSTSVRDHASRRPR